MRCRICDWSEGAPASLYNQGIQNAFKGKRFLICTDPETVEYTCNICEGKSDHEDRMPLREEQ